MEEPASAPDTPHRFFTVIGGALVTIFILSIAVFIVQQGDSRPARDYKTDFGETVGEDGREAFWYATDMPLGDTGFIASAGPFKYTDEDNDDWDYYEIEVQKPEGKVSHVCFVREFHLDAIPPDLIEAHVTTFTTYDPTTRTVTFTLGEEVHEYVLPE